MKICYKCKEELDESFFNKDKNRKDGLSPLCKNCSKKYREDNKETLLLKKREYWHRLSDERKTERRLNNARRYREDKPRRLEQMKKQREDNRTQFLLSHAKHRCKKDGKEFNLELSDIIIPEFCPILGVKLTSDQGKGQLQTNASLDRIDSTKGYIKGNVWVISRKANTMKSNATTEELKAFGKWCMTL